MKKIKYFNNKLISAFLAFAVLLVGVFSFGTIKQETASADVIANARPFTAENLEDFGYRLVDELNLPSTPQYACLLIDSDLLVDGSMEAVDASSLSDLEGLPFFVGLADGLADYYNLDNVARTASTLTVEQTINACNLQIVVFMRNSSNSICKNLNRGRSEANITTPQRFFNTFDYDTSMEIYAAGVWSITTRLDSILDRLQNYNNNANRRYAYPFYVFPRETIYDGGTLMISACMEDGFQPQY